MRDQGDLVEVQLGPMPTLFVTSPQLMNQVLVTDASKFHKGRMFDKFRPFVGNGLALSSGVKFMDIGFDMVLYRPFDLVLDWPRHCFNFAPDSADYHAAVIAWQKGI